MFESNVSHFSFKSLLPGGFDRVFDRVNLHRPAVPGAGLVREGQAGIE
jgi:hypothetical protein